MSIKLEDQLIYNFIINNNELNEISIEQQLKVIYIQQYLDTAIKYFINHNNLLYIYISEINNFSIELFIKLFINKLGDKWNLYKFLNQFEYFNFIPKYIKYYFKYSSITDIEKFDYMDRYKFENFYKWEFIKEILNKIDTYEFYILVIKKYYNYDFNYLYNNKYFIKIKDDQYLIDRILNYSNPNSYSNEYYNLLKQNKDLVYQNSLINKNLTYSSLSKILNIFKPNPKNLIKELYDLIFENKYTFENVKILLDYNVEVHYMHLVLFCAPFKRYNVFNNYVNNKEEFSYMKRHHGKFRDNIEVFKLLLSKVKNINILHKITYCPILQMEVSFNSLINVAYHYKNFHIIKLLLEHNAIIEDDEIKKNYEEWIIKNT